MVAVTPVSGRSLVRRSVWLLLTLLVLSAAGSRLPAAEGVALVVPDAPLEAPYTLVGSDVYHYSLVAPKLFWQVRPTCLPTRIPAPEGVGATANTTREAISRIATQGSEPRDLYEHMVDPVCGQQGLQLLSKSGADADYVYWFNGSGLWRLPVTANAGDPATLWSASVSGSGGEIAADDTYVYALAYDGSGNGYLWRVQKTTGTAAPLVAVYGYPRNLSAAGEYVFWQEGGNLRRIHRSGTSYGTIATGVTGYFAEGFRVVLVWPFNSTNWVYVAKGHEIYRYDNESGTTTGPYYTAAATTTVIHTLTTGSYYLSFFEARLVDGGGGFNQYQDVLRRTGRGGGDVANLYFYPDSVVASYQAHQLTTAGGYLFWRDGSLRRLPEDPTFAVGANVAIDRVEVTQGVQDNYNGVSLIQNKRTFVRVHTSSSGANATGITAHLSASWDGGSGGPLLPVNPIGTMLTVRQNPAVADLDDSFLFELPWAWTTKSNLMLEVDVNPYQLPLEPDFGDNGTEIGPLNFVVSPRIEVQVLSYGYELGGSNYWPDPVKDVTQSLSWWRRVYPLASTPGGFANTAPGLRVQTDTTFDEDLGAIMFQPASCASEPKGAGCDPFDVPAYVNNLAKQMHVDGSVPADRYIYSFVANTDQYAGAGLGWFGDRVAAGPAGTYLEWWDTDGSTADLVAGHELGHALGRPHTGVRGDDPATPDVEEGCGHSMDDMDYPYADALIGPDGPLRHVYGFDAGDAGLGLPKAVYLDDTWTDMMSYCPYKWISDFTYQCLYEYMLTGTQSAACDGNGATVARAEAAPAGPAAGDLLMVAGQMAADGSEARFHFLRRVNSVAEMPPLVPDIYSIRLLNGAGSTLADYPFTPDPVDDSGDKAFFQVVNWVAGTAEVQIVRPRDGLVLASQPASANAPVVSGVALVSPPSPVSGVVQLQWNATDADGGTLDYDVYYVRGDGSPPRLLQRNLAATGTTIDTAGLAGAVRGATFRVIASDGVNEGSGETTPFSMAFKVPVVEILTPASPTHIQWGQLVNFSGQAWDAQDGSIPESGLAWYDGDGLLLGTGSLLTLTDLPVGTNTITLQATNSDGRVGSSEVVVVVGDDLTPPPATLAVAPTQIGWQVESGTLALQTATLALHNGGAGGSLAWNAAVDVPWLSLSATAGSTPASLGFTADPAGIPPGGTAVATVTITGNGQTLVVPVTLTVGRQPWTCQATISALRGSQAGDDLLFSWYDLAGTEWYGLYALAGPYQSPWEATLLAEPAEPPFAHTVSAVLGDGVASYYALVATACGGNAAAGQRVGEFPFQLVPGGR